MKLKLGPVVHGVLLVVVLLFAYQSWTKGTKVASKVGTVTVWSNAKDSVVSLQSYNKGKRGVERTINIKKTKEGYIWGSDKRSRPKRRRPKKGQPPAPPEMVTTTSEFVGGEGADKAFEQFANLKALHGMGKLGEDKLKEYGLDKDNTIAVAFADRSSTLIVGNAVFGSTNRYVLDVASGKGYIVASPVIDPLLKGMSKLKLRKLHKFKDDDLSKVQLDTGKQKRTLIRSTVERNKRKIRTWTDESTPDTPDSTSNNFLNRINRLVPTKFEREVKAEDLTPALVTIAYYDKAGKKAGWFKLYKTKPAPEDEEDPDKKDDPTDPTKKKDDPTDATKKDATDVKKKPAGKTPVKKAPVKTAPVKKAPVKKGVGAGKKKTPGFDKLAGQAKPGAKKPVATKKTPATRKVKKTPIKKAPVKKPAAGKGKKDPKKDAKADPKKDAKDPKTVVPPVVKKRKKPIVYYVMTERTHVFARVPTRAASRIEEDLKDLYDLGKSRKRPPGKNMAPGMRKAPKNFRVPKRPGGPGGRPGMRRPGMRRPGMPGGRPGMRRPGMRRPGMPKGMRNPHGRRPGRIPPGLPGSRHKSTLKAKPKFKVTPKKK